MDYVSDPKTSANMPKYIFVTGGVVSSLGKGLTRPELAVVFSYAKIGLTSQLMASKIVEDVYFDETLETYFTAWQSFGGAGEELTTEARQSS